MNSHPLNILSAPCTPYVIGYSLNRAQLIALAPRICSAEELSSVSASYPDVALNRHMKSKKLQEGFLPYKEADGLVYYLWFKGVVPSFTGNNPNAPVPPIDLDVYPSLRNLDGLGHVKRRCIVWPKYFSVPDWFYPRLTKFTLKHMERLKKKQQELEKEKQTCQDRGTVQ